VQLLEEANEVDVLAQANKLFAMYTRNVNSWCDPVRVAAFVGRVYGLHLSLQCELKVLTAL